MISQPFTEKHPNYSSVTAELGALYHDQGRYKEVKEIYEEAIDISLQVSGKESLNYVLQINNLGYLYEDMGNAISNKGHFHVRKKVPGRRRALFAEDLRPTLHRFGK